MAKGFKGPGMGRPPTEWTPEKIQLFHTLMGIAFVTEENIADILKIDVSTLVRWIKKTYGVTFADLKKQKQAGMKLKLAGKQYETAMKGNVPMLIWLGKQWLDQSDKQESKIEQKVTLEDLVEKSFDQIVKD